ncbi:hypothetical protein GSI_10898 [Ganoderma sinense ZZ0214-1]|uniref:Berberine/berberine-like domain-containing protein n=1 Tax=Ganoderma sinense ZZ0214-1 TaxID=1077348 RepID=A0A2G8S1V4_9APHY|nr:hypothetical protein GSI_10898 [Ganoderma sinense ZZ0214-1]
MLAVRGSLLPVLFALLVRCDPAQAVADLLDAASQSSSLSSALRLLNSTIGGKLRTAVPFEKACFSIVEGLHVNVSAAACAALQTNYTNPVYRVDYFGAYMLPQWETCQASSVTNGCLLDSNNVSNPLAFDGVDCRLGNVPPYYINVHSVKDVQAALAFSNLTGVRLSVKNKGHDYKGRSSGRNTLALWAGVFTQDVYEFADSINRTIIGGYHQTVGFSGGYFLGGGHSILTPVYGLAVDRVVEVKVVTPDGVYRTANECQNQDLFFALRGGGGSAFGVVIESTHRTEPKFALQAAVLRFTPTGSDLADWYSLLVNNSLQWANDGWGGHIVGPSLIHVTPLLNTTAARASMQPAIDFVTARNGSAVIEELPSWLAFFEKYVPSAQAAVGPELDLGTRLLPSRLFSTASGRAQLSALINETLAFASPYLVAGTPWLYKPRAGAAGATATTPAWRDAVWHLSVKWQFEYNDTLAARADGYRTLSAHIQRFRDLAPESGAYFNEGDVYEPDHEVAYWGTENYEKLLAVKRRYC